MDQEKTDGSKFPLQGDRGHLSSPFGGQGALSSSAFGGGHGDVTSGKSGILLSLLVAADENNIIGKDNQLPWHLPNDLKYFKNQTWGLPILMGRKTFESIGKPLPGRKSIVITRNRDWKHEGVTVVHSVDEAIGMAAEFGVKEVFVIGGAEIFKTSFNSANRIYLTRVHHQFDGDAHFPSVPENEWELKQSRFCEADEKNAYSHTFQVWERKK